jgi:hypothetical protein
MRIWGLLPTTVQRPNASPYDRHSPANYEELSKGLFADGSPPGTWRQSFEAARGGFCCQARLMSSMLCGCRPRPASRRTQPEPGCGTFKKDFAAKADHARRPPAGLDADPAGFFDKPLLLDEPPEILLVQPHT